MSQGRLAHIELPTTDLSSSRRFYEKLFGWQFDTIPGWDTYAVFTMPGGQEGGLTTESGDRAPSAAGPVLYLEVSDVDAALVGIAKMGGKTITPKTKISDEFGFFALFLDNVGNRLGLWSKT